MTYCGVVEMCSSIFVYCFDFMYVVINVSVALV